ncbi:rna-binding protein hypothetical protein [Limosa lapponica baueri]|uniref:RRM domain-containing protein n=1 Tax=Limosa lapponica baueri TaxID=1758121 RepID=A0A2I0T3C2_LIMLA|nr:rna-binding protein hypothetical protein [Limosa lapponica baueri]
MWLIQQLQKQSVESKKGGKKAATSKELSDMDYLKSKVVKDSSSSSSSEEETESEEVEEESESEEDSGIAETIGTHTDKRGKPKAQQTQQEAPVEKKKKKKGSTLEEKIREFFLPLKPVAIRIGKNARGKNTGCIFVDLKSEAEVQRALKRKKEYIEVGSKLVEL